MNSKEKELLAQYIFTIFADNGVSIYMGFADKLADGLIARGYGRIDKFAEKVKPIISELVEMLFDDNVSTCKVENCDKADDIQCGANICIEENKAYWNGRIDKLLEEYKNESN